MSYNALKNELEQLLKEDLSNRSSLQEMRRNIFLNSESVSRRQQELIEKENVIAGLHEKVQKEAASNESKDEQIAELSSLISALRAENEAQKIKLSADSGIWDEMNKLTVENNHFATKIRDLILHIDAQNEKEENLNKEITQRNSQIRSLISEKERIQTEIENLTQAKLFSGEEQDKVNEENTTLREKIILLQAQLSEATLLLNAQNNQLKLAEDALAVTKLEFKQAVESLLGENALLVADNASLIADHDLLKYDFERLKKENAESLCEVGMLNEKLRAQMISFETERAELLSKIEALKKEQEFQNENQNMTSLLRSEAEQYRSDLKNLVTEFEEYKSQSVSKIRSLESENDGLQLQIESLMGQSTHASTTFSFSNEQESEEFINRLFKQIDQLNDEKLQLSGQKEEVEEQVGILQSKLVELSQIIENQNGEIKSLEDKNKQAKLAQTLVFSSKDKTATKLKINELVREIDKCIALLSV